MDWFLYDRDLRHERVEGGSRKIVLPFYNDVSKAFLGRRFSVEGLGSALTAPMGPGKKALVASWGKCTQKL